jgi:hypothetical protein
LVKVVPRMFAESAVFCKRVAEAATGALD